MRAGLAITMMVAAACGGGESSRIVIEGAPYLALDEGEQITAQISVQPLPAVPVVAADFDLGFEAGGADLFRRAEIVDVDGVATLVLEPRCDVVAPGGADALTSVLVSTDAVSADPADSVIQIGGEAGAGCLPRVVAWSGDCAAAPVAAGQAVVLPAGAEALCLWVENMDPTNERLWIRMQTDAPSTLIDAADLPEGDEVADPQPAAVTLGNTTEVRGEFRIDYQLYRGDPNAGSAAVAAGSIAVTLGDVGTSVEPIRVPSATPEFSVGDAEFRVWHRAAVAGGVATCARAVIVDPTPAVADRAAAVHAKATARLYGDGGGVAEVDEWLCSRSFRLAYSPPVDSRASETVRIDASVCDCSGVAQPASDIVTHDVVFPVESVAGTMVCDDAFQVTDSVDIVCADLDGDADTTPDVVVRTVDTLCVFSGDGGRHSVAAVDTFTALAGPRKLQSMVRQTSAGSEPLVLAVERTGPGANRVVRLRMPAVAGQPPTWESFPPLADVSASLNFLMGIAPQANAPATYLGYVVPVGPNLGVRLRCADENTCCTAPGVCDQTQVAIDDLGGQESIAGLLPADIDGDGSDEVVVFTIDDATGSSRIHARVLPVTWSAGAPTFGAGPFTRLGGMNVDGTGLRVAAPQRTCPSAPCPEDAYAVPVGIGGEAVIYKLVGGGSPSITSQQTPSAALDVTGVGTMLMVGLDYGLYQALGGAQGIILSWIARDPVLLEQSVAGVLRSPAPGYGSRLAACLGTGGDSSVAVAATLGTARYTKLSLDVSEP